MTNWSGSMRFSRRHHREHRTTAEVAGLVRTARARRDPSRQLTRVDASSGQLATTVLTGWGTD
ncbi:hypothetical protein D9V41_10630 [Aeromicrobium phragmitis]|uniref:Uncharacterized protein n=1 Tax=Aeromicrobium phragmitis TaxID=2478914 RepID=A0A3L8PJM4_9ACTN|nr:hypothetical protein D9V41_10630 [Aeromicrobium phragmitis]